MKKNGLQPNPNGRHQSESMYCVYTMYALNTWFIHGEALMQFQCNPMYRIGCQKDQNTNLIIHWTFANCSFEMNKSRDSTEWRFVLYSTHMHTHMELNMQDYENDNELVIFR